MSTNLTVVRKSEPGPDLSIFVEHLRAARILYRDHPELVTAPAMPEPYLSAFREQNDHDPEAGSCANYDCPCERAARFWQEHGLRRDARFLKELGIEPDLR